VPLDAAIFALPLALLAGLFKGTAIVGTDGVVIRWLTSRFVPFGDVAELRKDQGAGPVRLLLRTGKRMTLQAVEEPEADADRGAKGLALHRHLEESLGRFRQRKTAAEAVALLRRNDRSPKDWGLAIDSIVRSNAGGYRVATIAEQTLMEVATGTEGPLDARVGAAAALIRRVGFDGASRTDEERRIRVAVRIAADACVERRARVALEALADAQSADELERALGYLTEP
jgi:hypothetical protein